MNGMATMNSLSQKGSGLGGLVGTTLNQIPLKCLPKDVLTMFAIKPTLSNKAPF